MKDDKKHLDIDLEFLDNKESVRVAPKQEVKEVSTEERLEPSAATTTHPWMRYWARSLDMCVFSLAIGIFLGISMPSVLESYSSIILILFIWIFAESALLSSWGTTPGKWLLGINLAGPGGKPEFSVALNRSFAVWLKGLGLGIPIINLFTLVSSYNYLIKEGAAPWDKDNHLTMTHGKISAVRTTAIIIVSIAFLFLIFGE